MAQGYLRHELDEPASFELFVRALPPERRFLVACGLEHAVDHLEALDVGDDGVDGLASLGRFDDALLGRLRELRFTGDVWAVPEGEFVFAGEPLLRVTAPLVEASLVETALLNLVGHATVVASKAARVALACGGRPFVDYGARRAHGPDAALLGARAAWVGGAAGTSLVAAGLAFDIPLSGTMAHAFVQRFPTESEAFLAYGRSGLGEVTLLLDTYDTEAAALVGVDVTHALAAEGIVVGAVRLDSGDLRVLSGSVRRILDDGGCRDVRIVVSGDLDEERIAALLAAGAPIDGFGVGTRLAVSADAPSLSIVYKLVEDRDGPTAKRSPGKATLPGRKQVWRFRDEDGCLRRDVVGLADEPGADGGTPLLQRVMAGGRRLGPAAPLSEARQRCHDALGSLPPVLRALEPWSAPPYPVDLSPGLSALVAGRVP